MNKIFKVLGCLLLFTGLIFSTTCFATDINMNLETDTDANSVISNNLDDSSLNANSQMTTTVESSSRNDTEGLGINSILNILLIVVGFVLILLGIAVLIRLGR